MNTVNNLISILLSLNVYLLLTIQLMAYSKIGSFSTGEQEIARLAKSLSHPARVAIIKVLAKYQQSLCGEIVAELPLSQSTVSQHLKELRTAGLIKGKQDGPAVVYSVDALALIKAEKKLAKFFKKQIAKLEE